MGISPKVLSQTLRALERHGVVTRRASPEMPPRVEYALTPLGETLREPLAPVRDWAQIHVHDILAARERADAESSV